MDRRACKRQLLEHNAFGETAKCDLTRHALEHDNGQTRPCMPCSRGVFGAGFSAPKSLFQAKPAVWVVSDLTQAWNP